MASIDQSSDPTNVSILCPLQNRRESKEIFIKLFIVHFTCVVAFCHLISISKEPFYLRPLGHILWPLKLAFQFVFLAFGAVLIIIFLLIFFTITAIVTNKVPFALGTRLERPRPGGGPSPRDLEQNDTSTDTHETVTPSQPMSRRELGEAIGRTIVVSAYLCQCITTIILFHRRLQHSHEAVSASDVIIYKLALGGIPVALLSLGITTRLTVFKRSVADWPDSMTEGSAWMLSLLPFQPSDWITSSFVYLVTEGIVGSLYSHTFFRFFIRHLPNGHFDNSTAVGVMIFECGLGRVIARKISRRGIRVLLVILLSVFGAFLLFHYCWQVLHQIATFDVWPQHEACPMLWKDPWEDWTWALA